MCSYTLMYVSFILLNILLCSCILINHYKIMFLKFVFSLSCLLSGLLIARTLTITVRLKKNCTFTSSLYYLANSGVVSFVLGYSTSISSQSITIPINLAKEGMEAIFRITFGSRALFFPLYTQKMSLATAMNVLQVHHSLPQRRLQLPQCWFWRARKTRKGVAREISGGSRS